MISELWSTILFLLILKINFNPSSISPWIVQVILNFFNNPDTFVAVLKE